MAQPTQGNTIHNVPAPPCATLVALYHPTIQIPIFRAYKPLIFGKSTFQPFHIDETQSLEDKHFSLLVCLDEIERLTFRIRDLSKQGTFVNGLHASNTKEVRYGGFITFGTTPLKGSPALVLQLRKQSPAPQICNEFRIGKIIGEGGFSVVKLAHRHCTDTKFAVKVIRRCNLPGFSDDPTQREIDIIRAVKHPNIVSIIDIFQDICRHYVVMELAPLGSAEDLLKERMHVDQSLVRETARNICPALQCLHRMNYVHRDIKPANLLLFSLDPPLIKLSDFGLARKLAGGPLFQSIVGTRSYMAPELISYQQYDARVDIWSLGRTLFSLLFGIDENLNKLPLLPCDLAKQVLMGMLEKDPEVRWSLEEVLQSQWLEEEEEEEEENEEEEE
ncbi:hypothetical protein QCA50_019431 [Cerrena zonata]|uniref:Uncharacterized protein n=1 Tax=Cerrena zonata TaxID=2478898 RepID=A0AAW0FLN4_9APHY